MDFILIIMKFILIATLLVSLTISTDAVVDGSCLDDVKDRLTALIAQNSDLQSQKVTLQAANDQKTSALNLVNGQVDSCNAKTPGYQQQKDDLNTSITDLMSQIVTLTTQLNGLDDQITGLQADLSTCNDENSNITDSNTALTNQNNDLSTQITQLTSQSNDLTSQLVQCGSVLTAAENKVANLNSQITELNIQNAAFISGLKDQIAEAIASLQTYVNGINDQLTALEAVVVALNSTRDDLVSEIAALDAQIEILRQKLADCRGCSTLSTSFEFSLQYACRSGVAFDSAHAKFFWNDVLITEIIPSDYDLHNFSAIVEITSGTNTLRLEGAGTPDSDGLTIDNVQLKRNGVNVNIVVNGDFELPNQEGEWGIYTSIPGWTGSDIEVGNGEIYNGVWDSQIVELDGNTNTIMSQTFVFDDNYVFTANPDVDTCNALKNLLTQKGARDLLLSILNDSISSLSDERDSLNGDVDSLNLDINSIVNATTVCGEANDTTTNNIVDLEAEIVCRDTKISAFRDIFDAAVNKLATCS
jgi:predicted  nucleic acid-binding Zn-ribbon protein